MELIETKVSSEQKFSGKILKLTVDDVLLADGSPAKREVIHHPGGVGILPVDDAGMCYMVRQFRYPPAQAMLEIPAGKLEWGEDHYACAVRELSEETGFSADNLVYLGYFYPTPAYDTEKIHVYLATGLHAGERHLDEGEFLNIEKISLDELHTMAMEGSIIDAKTLVAVLKAKLYLEAEK